MNKIISGERSFQWLGDFNRSSSELRIIGIAIMVITSFALLWVLTKSVFQRVGPVEVKSSHLKGGIAVSDEQLLSDYDSLDSTIENIVSQRGNSFFLPEREHVVRWPDVLSPRSTHVARGDRSLYTNEEGQWLNANYVQLGNGSPCIASQCPGIKDYAAFASLVYREVGLIVDLTSDKDRRGENEHWLGGTYYFPERLYQQAKRGGFVISCTKVLKETEDLFLYTYEIKESKSLQKKKVERLHFKGWPDCGAISAKDLIALSDRVDALLQRSGEGMPLIHCRAGVGRTGTLITAREIIDKLRRGDELCRRRILELIVLGREQRGFCFVQSPSQLNSLYSIYT